MLLGLRPEAAVYAREAASFRSYCHVFPIIIICERSGHRSFISFDVTSLRMAGRATIIQLEAFVGRGGRLEDMQAHLEKLRSCAAECALIRDLATDVHKRKLFANLAGYLSLLALEVERVIAAKKADEL
jgi:hypothetical protein